MENLKELWRTNVFFRFAVLIALVGAVVLLASPVPT